VTIYSLEDVEYNYPKLKFTVRVSSGTYIRSLAEDIGQKLCTGAYMSALRRTQVGQLDIKNGLKVEDLSLSAIEKHLQK
jgi:tRNA pseudouridine55 synthase